MDKRTTGVYNKFLVYRTDGKDAPGGKHDGCVYFVLDATHDPHAKPALVAYADSCESAFPALATDVRNMATLPPVELPAGPSRPVEAAIDSLSELLCDEDLSEAIDAEMSRPVEATPTDSQMLDWLDSQHEVDSRRGALIIQDGVERKGNMSRLYLWLDDTQEVLFEGKELREAIRVGMASVPAPPADTAPPCKKCGGTKRYVYGREYDCELSTTCLDCQPPADTREPSKCGHKWDESIHRGCPRCAVAIADAWLKTFADRWRAVLKESSPSGEDFGNSTVAGIAKAALDELAKGVSKEFLDSLAVDTREPRRVPVPAPMGMQIAPEGPDCDYVFGEPPADTREPIKCARCGSSLLPGGQCSRFKEGCQGGWGESRATNPTDKESLSVQTGPAEPVRELWRVGWIDSGCGPMYTAPMSESNARISIGLFNPKTGPRVQYSDGGNTWQDADTSAAEGTKE